MGGGIKTLSSSLHSGITSIAPATLTPYQSLQGLNTIFSKTSTPHATMSVDANTQKPHGHHALPKDIPEDDGLRNHAAPGVSKFYMDFEIESNANAYRSPTSRPSKNPWPVQLLAWSMANPRSLSSSPHSKSAACRSRIEFSSHLSASTPPRMAITQRGISPILEASSSVDLVSLLSKLRLCKLMDASHRKTAVYGKTLKRSLFARSLNLRTRRARRSASSLVTPVARQAPWRLG